MADSFDGSNAGPSWLPVRWGGDKDREGQGRQERRSAGRVVLGGTVTLVPAVGASVQMALTYRVVRLVLKTAFDPNEGGHASTGVTCQPRWETGMQAAVSRTLAQPRTSLGEIGWASTPDVLPRFGSRISVRLGGWLLDRVGLREAIAQEEEMRMAAAGDHGEEPQHRRSPEDGQRARAVPNTHSLYGLGEATFTTANLRPYSTTPGLRSLS